jgi:hypothetical protein
MKLLLKKSSLPDLVTIVATHSAVLANLVSNIKLDYRHHLLTIVYLSLSFHLYRLSLNLTLIILRTPSTKNILKLFQSALKTNLIKHQNIKNLNTQPNETKFLPLLLQTKTRQQQSAVHINP